MAAAAAAAVKVYAYDLTGGMAAALSPMLLGRQVAAIWHTAVVVRGIEYFFGMGIQRARAGTTPFGAPLRVLDFGTTELDDGDVDGLLASLADGEWAAGSYSLLSHNCNHFTHELLQILTGRALSDEYLRQSDLLFTTELGRMLLPMVEQLEGVTGRATAAALGAPGASGGGDERRPAAASAAAAAAPAAAASAEPPAAAAGTQTAAAAAGAAALVRAAAAAEAAGSSAAASSSGNAGRAGGDDDGKQAAAAPGAAAVAAAQEAGADGEADLAGGKAADAVAGLRLTADSSSSGGAPA